MPDHLKVENAITLYKASGASSLIMAELYEALVRACRKEIVAPIQEIVLTEPIRTIETELIGELAADEEPETDAEILLERAKGLLQVHTGARTAKQRLNDAELLVLHVQMGAYCDRLGDLEGAARNFDRAASYARAINPDPVCTKKLMQVVKPRLDMLQKESEAMARAVAHTRQALADGAYRIKKEDLPPELRESYSPREELARRTYLVGEWLRRVDRPRRALEWLTAAGVMAESALLRRWIRDRLALPELMRAEPSSEDAEILAQVMVDAGLKKTALDGALARLRQEARTQAENQAAAQGDAPQERAQAAAPQADRRLSFDGAPQEPQEVLRRIAAGLEAYRRDHDNKWPARLSVLVTEGYLTQESSGGFQDPVSGADFRLSTADLRSDKDIIVFPNKLRLCPWVLQADGTIKPLK
jgi:hypothetical protein